MIGLAEQPGLDPALEYLADFGARQVRPHLDLLGGFDAAQAGFDECMDVIVGDILAGVGWMTAVTRSPRLGSDSPITAQSSTPGCSSSACSTSAGAPLAVSCSAAYGVFDGLFQQALIRHLSGSADAARDLEENVQRVLESLTIRG